MKTNFIKSFIFLFLIGFLVLAPVSILANNGSQKGDAPVGSGIQQGDAPVDPDAGKIKNPINAKTINEFIKSILEAVIKIGIPIIALAIIYSGFLFVFARGIPEKLETAKKALLYSVIGAVILLGSWAIVQIISNTILAL